VTFEEQIMSKDKINVWSIFTPQMEAIVFIIIQIFFASCENWRIFSDNYSPVLAGEYLVT